MSAVQRPGTPLSSERERKPAARPAPSAPPPPAPVIPTSWLAPDEQRRLVLWTLGLIEFTKVWDVLAPHFSDVPASVASSLRVRGPWSAGIWAGAEIILLIVVSLLRIPGLSPSPTKVVLLVPLFAVWNVVCWFLADPLAFVPKASMFGPVHLGEEGLFWGWVYLVGHVLRTMVLGQPEHLAGVHSIRLLPFSTATLNPLALTYCLPTAQHDPTYVAVVFNNSIPYQISYSVTPLYGNGEKQTYTTPASLMHRPVGWQALQLKDTPQVSDDDDGDGQMVAEIVSNRAHKLLDYTRLHSVRPHEALSIVPPDLTSSESLLYIKVDRPAIITLNSVVDKNGDRFQLAPNREAVIIECPSGGEFVDEIKGALIKHPHAGKEPEDTPLRCTGGEEMLQFSVRGVAPLSVSWTKRIGGVIVNSGTAEGIEDADRTAEAERGEYRRTFVTRDHAVPLRAFHERAGHFEYQLTHVVDALGNTWVPPVGSSTMSFHVIDRRDVHFLCPKPIQILVNGTATLPVSIAGPEKLPMDVTYGFTTPDGNVVRQRVEMTPGNRGLAVNDPGTFTLLGIDGTCAGSIVEPAACSVQLIPPPTAEMSFTTLHECAMDVGVRAAFEFTGTGPFVIRWTEAEKGGPEKAHTKTFQASGGEVDFRPHKEGKYIYRILSLSDKHYKELPLNRDPIEQVVHPPASVEIKSSTSLKYWACSPDEVPIALEVSGHDPLKLTYRTSWDRRSENDTVAIKSGKQTITVPVPRELASDSGNTGKLTITLMTVEDGKGCVKRLPAHQVEVDVDRHIPTVRFARADSVIVTEGEKVGVPLRLTGHPPWTVTYALDGVPQPAATFKANNAPLSFSHAGKYELVGIKDQHCSGDAGDEEFLIAFKPKPEATLVESISVSREKGKAERFVHKGLCAGQEDAVAVRFQGAAPFDAQYRYTFGTKHVEQHLRSAQSVGVLQLSTEPGKHHYRFESVTDANYKNTPVDFTLEHEVFKRPSMQYARGNTRSLCRDSALSTDAKVKLKGLPPFNIIVGVRRPASAEITTHEVKVPSNEWTVALPDVILDDVGRWEITLLDVGDMSGCAYERGTDERERERELALLSTTIDVVDTATVVPIQHETDVCVGDTLDFLLQGKAPWLVEYEWEGKRYTVTASKSRFSRSADAAGVFAIRSIALKDRSGTPQCKRAVDGLERTIHALPTARIQDGLDNLREGDQPAVFEVHFSGTPPFAFTYSRSEIGGNGKRRIVETQTITDIWEESYTISSSAPGDYAVTSVQDKFCRYPPLTRARADVG